MSEDINSVPILIRREIEALIAAPLLKAFTEEFGQEKTLEVAGKVISRLAQEGGQKLVELVGGNQLSDMNKVTTLFGKSGALEIESVSNEEQKMEFNIVRCKYAEMYKDLGLENYGFLLSCHRDSALFKGFNPNFKFSRTKTIMEGDDCCDFCLETT